MPGRKPGFSVSSEVMKLSFPSGIIPLLNGRKVYCSLSGGADSLALLLFLEAEREKARYTLEAVHFEHGFRGRASVADADFCRKICERRSIPLAVFHIDVPRKRMRGEGDEEAARRIRLEYWRKIVFNPEQSLVALGHHAGDRIENVLLRLFRGSNSTGLSSMRPVQKIGRITFIRPFLDNTRADLEEFLRGQQILKWRNDATNRSTVYKRNLIRNRLLPEIRRAFPFAEAGILQSVRTLDEDAAFLEDAADQAYASLSALSAPEDWRALPPALLPRVLRRFLSDKAGCDIVPDSRLIERFRTTLACPDNGRRRLIPIAGQKDFRLAVRGDKVECVQRSARPPLPDAPWDIRKTNRLEFGSFALTAELVPPENLLFTTDKSTAYFDASMLDAPLTVGIWRAGDRMIPFGRKTPVLLKKLFSDAGAPPEWKRTLPLLRNSRGAILWAPFVRNSAFAPVTRDTKQAVKFLAVPLH